MSYYKDGYHYYYVRSPSGGYVMLIDDVRECMYPNRYEESDTPKPTITNTPKPTITNTPPTNQQPSKK